MIRTGECPYCGQITQVEAPLELEQENVNDLAIEKCDCPDEKKEMNRRISIQNAQEAIDETCAGTEEKVISEIMKSLLNPVYRGLLKKITINSFSGRIWTIAHTDDVPLSIEWKKTEKEEVYVKN